VLLPNGQPDEVSASSTSDRAGEADAFVTALALGKFRNLTALPPSNFAFTSGDERL